MYSASKKKYLSWSASSLWDVWMNSASTAVWTTFQILLIKSCLDRGSPLLSCYWVCAEQETLCSSKLSLPQQTCKTKVNGLQCMARYSGCYCITEGLHREEFCRFLTVFKEMFKLKLVKHLCRTFKWIFTLAHCSIKLYKLWKSNLSLLLSLLERLFVSANLICFCLCL